MGFFSRLFGGGASDPAVAAALAAGGTVVDVRSEAEFAGGHAAGARNFPLPALPWRLDELRDLPTPLVLCCRSGARSTRGLSVLAKAGLSGINGGSWQAVARAQAAVAKTS